jgi:hypothetical protein
MAVSMASSSSVVSGRLHSLSPVRIILQVKGEAGNWDGVEGDRASGFTVLAVTADGKATAT